MRAGSLGWGIWIPETADQMRQRSSVFYRLAWNCRPPIVRQPMDARDRHVFFIAFFDHRNRRRASFPVPNSFPMAWASLAGGSPHRPNR